MEAWWQYEDNWSVWGAATVQILDGEPTDVGVEQQTVVFWQSSLGLAEMGKRDVRQVGNILEATFLDSSVGFAVWSH